MNKYEKELKKARDKVRASRLARASRSASYSSSYWASRSASYSSLDSASYSYSDSALDSASYWAWASAWASDKAAKDKTKELNYQIDLVLKELDK